MRKISKVSVDFQINRKLPIFFRKKRRTHRGCCNTSPFALIISPLLSHLLYVYTIYRTHHSMDAFFPCQIYGACAQLIRREKSINLLLQVHRINFSLSFHPFRSTILITTIEKLPKNQSTLIGILFGCFDYFFYI